MTDRGGVRDRTSGTYSLVLGVVVVAVCLVVLSVLATVSRWIATTAIVADVLLLAGMVVARFTVRPVKRRQWTIAGCLLAACVLSLAAVVLIGSLPPT